MNKILEKIVEGSGSHLLLSDLNETMKKGSIKINTVPNLSLLTEIWAKNVRVGDFINPYRTFVSYLLTFVDIKTLINQSPLVISHEFIALVFSVCNIKNKNASYNFDDFEKPTNHQYYPTMENAHFDGKKFCDFGKITIEDITRLWLSKFEKDLRSKKDVVYSQDGIISTFYRFLQWNRALRNDSSEKLLKAMIRDYIKENNSNQNFIIQATKECANSSGVISDLLKQII